MLCACMLNKVGRMLYKVGCMLYMVGCMLYKVGCMLHTLMQGTPRTHKHARYTEYSQPARAYLRHVGLSLSELLQRPVRAERELGVLRERRVAHERRHPL